jgi:hypothetical protein
MAAGQKVVVDGSNIATEGRSAPSLAQLDEAVRAYLAEHPDADITVVVDATFGHRIDDSERQLFEEARSAGEMVSPPAGAIGRGDAFLLRIAEKTGATVLSNDSFQEFHGEHEWLFTTGRLIGGVPVAGVGWIFTPRSPVRGPKSRQSVQEAKRDRRRREPTKAEARQKANAIAQATEEATESEGSRRRRRRRGKPSPSEPLNDPLPFLTFVSAHPLGSELEGVVEEFSSHGAFISAGDVRCYIPLSALADPPPRAARDVLDKGQTRTFVVQALDPLRRGIELALPGFAHVAGAPTDETVEAEIEKSSVAHRTSRGTRAKQAAPVKAARIPARAGAAPDAEARPRRANDGPTRRPQIGDRMVRRAQSSAAVVEAEKLAEAIVEQAPEPTILEPEPVKKATTKKPTTKKAATKKAPAKKKAAAKKAAATAATEKATTKKAAAKKAGAAEKPTVGKSTATKVGPSKSTAQKASANKASAKKVTAKKATTKKSPAKKAATATKKAPPKKAPAKTSAKKATAKKAAPAKKAAASGARKG